MTKEQAFEIIKNSGIDYTFSTGDIVDALLSLHINSKDFAVADGVSKCCIIFHNASFVIKFRKGNEYQEEENECLREIQLYKIAKEAGLEMFFPATEFLGKIKETYFTIQQKIDFSVSDCSYNKMNKYENICKTVKPKTIDKMRQGFKINNCDYNRILDSLWASMVISIYGKKLCKKLCNFIQENRINDLHNDNIGYLNDKPVLIDFAGYYK